MHGVANEGRWTDGVLVYELSEHETHDLHRYSGSAVLEHLSGRGTEEGERGQLELNSGQRPARLCQRADSP